MTGAAALFADIAAPLGAAERELSVAISIHLSAAPAYMGIEAGYFKKAGFQINPVQLNGPNAVSLLVGGRLDAMFSALPVAFVNALDRGTKGALVAGREIATKACTSGMAMYVNRNSLGSRPTATQVRGKRIAARKRGLAEFALFTYLQTLGLKTSDVEVVDLPIGEALAALAAGKLDGMLDPEVSRLPADMSRDLVPVWRLEDKYPGLQFSFIFFGPNMMDDVETGARFLAAYLSGARDFSRGRTPAFLSEFARKNRLDEASVKSGCRNTFTVDGKVDVTSVQRILDWQASQGYAPSMKADKLIDLRFLKRAHELLKSGKFDG